MLWKKGRLVAIVFERQTIPGDWTNEDLPLFQGFHFLKVHSSFLWMFSMEAFYLTSWDMGGSTSLLGTLCALTSGSYFHPTPLCLDSGLSWKPLSMKCPFLSSRCHLCSVLSWANTNKILTLPVKVSTQKWTEVQLPQDQETRTSRLLKLRLVLRCMYKSLTWSTNVLETLICDMQS